MGRYEEATKERAAAKEILSKNKYLIPEADSKAFQNSDIAYLSERAKDPTSGIAPDPNLPNVYRLASEKLVPRINIGEALNKSKALLSDGDYDYNKKSTINVNGRTKVQVPLKIESLNKVGQIFLQDKVNYDNFVDSYKPEILKKMQANPNMEEPAAALKVYTEKLSEIGKVERDVTPSKGITINNSFSSDGKGSFSSKDKKINLTEVEPTSTIKQGEYLYTRTGAKPDVVNLNVGGREDAVKKFKDVTYVGKIDNTKGYVIGTREMTIPEMSSPEGQKYLNDSGMLKELEAEMYKSASKIENNNSSNPSQKRVYICSDSDGCCKSVITSNSKPADGICNNRKHLKAGQIGHRWNEVGQQGNKQFKCNKCSIVVNTKDSPRGGGCCSVGGCSGGHTWSEIK
jgi:hypothetical protein